MVKSFKNLSKWSFSKSADNLVAICDRIAHSNFGFASTASKISDGINSPLAYKIYFIFCDFFSLKLCQIRILLFIVSQPRLNSLAALHYCFLLLWRFKKLYGFLLIFFCVHAYWLESIFLFRCFRISLFQFSDMKFTGIRIKNGFLLDEAIFFFRRVVFFSPLRLLYWILKAVSNSLKSC